MLRGKGMYESILDNIPGLGKVNRVKLLNHFKTITRIEKASLEELKKVVNIKLANTIYDYFHNDIE